MLRWMRNSLVNTALGRQGTTPHPRQQSRMHLRSPDQSTCKRVVLQINIRIGAGAVLAFVLLAVIGAWYAREHGWLNLEPGRQDFSGVSTKSPEFISTNGGVLTVAWVKGYETFERRSPSELEVGLFKVPLPFGETVSEISTAAKYQYQIRLDKRWPIRCSQSQCVVRTGPIELADPVAIYHDETKWKTASGWARFDKAQNLEALNRSLGQVLAARGSLPRNRDLALRDGRAEVEKFVREWLVREKFSASKIVVLYPGEQLVDGKPIDVH